MTKRSIFRRLVAANAVAIAMLFLPVARPAAAANANEPMETIEVRGSLAEVRKQILTFVSEVTRSEGELIGRWETRICPMIGGVSDDQAAYMRHRLLEVEAEARRRKVDETRACQPNVF